MNSAADLISNFTSEERRALLGKLLRKKITESRSLSPLSHGQRALWYLYLLAPESSAYNVSFCSRIRSELDIGAFQMSFQRLVNRHSILRTTYGLYHGSPMQNTHEHGEYQFRYINARDWSMERLKQCIAEDYDLPFDLENGPVMRVALFECGDNDYVMMLTVHHIAVDLWSLTIFIDELLLIYPFEKKGMTPPLPPLAYEYKNFISWQNHMINSEKGNRSFAFWKNLLKGELTPTNLLTDYARPSVQTYNGAAHAFELSESLSARIKAYTKSEGVTLYTFLLVVFQVLLHRYTNQNDILVGSPSAGLSRSRFEDVVGYFVNPVVVRTNVSPEAVFHDLLMQTGQTVLDALEHQDYPFPLLVERLQPERDPSRVPIFQVMFAYQKLQRLPELLEFFIVNRNDVKLEFGGLTLEPFFMPQREGQFDLSLEMSDHGQRLFGLLKYNRDLFRADTLERMTEHFTNLLESVLSDPQRKVCDLSLLNESQLQKLFAENNSVKTTSEVKCIHQLFEERAARFPDGPAVVQENICLNYGELNRRANQLARYLRGRGVGPEIRVGLCMERSVALIAAIMGVLKCGGTYLPLDPDSPKDRFAYMLEDAGVNLVLCDSITVEKIDASAAELLSLDTLGEELERENGMNPNYAVYPENAAYIIYTSGTLGKPKGVVIQHRSLVGFSRAAVRTYGLKPEDRVLQFASISFDTSAEEIYPALICGAALVLRTDAMLTTFASFLKKCDEWKITVLDLPTAYWHELTMAIIENKLLMPVSLRLTIIGGERALVARLTAWHESQHEKIRLLNTYGPTESTVVATVGELSSLQQPEKLRELPIGYALENVKTYVLDARGTPTPVGIAGELHIGGNCLARGYLNRPELTAAKFLPDPFSKEKGGRLYRTGDLARYLSDGSLEFLGRIDFQVKIRGFRVELGEVESMILRYPGVRQVVVTTYESAPGERRMVVYLCSQLIVDLQSLDSPFAQETLADHRRTDFRVPCEVPFLLDAGDGQIIESLATDISYSGVSLSNMPAPLKENSVVHLLMQGSKDKSWVRGRVVRSGDHGIGVHFHASVEKASPVMKWMDAIIRRQEFVVWEGRRADIRIPLEVSCLLEWEGGHTGLVTQNISLSGAFLTGKMPPFKKNQSVRLGLLLSEKVDRLWVDGEIIWYRNSQAGVKFNIRQEERNSIRDYLHKYIEEEGLTVKHLRAFLKDNLPDYMLPSVFMLLDTMPLTTSGKVDLRKLPLPHRTVKQTNGDYVEPSSPVEKKLAKIWAQTLRLEKVGVHDNFFELGGDSILTLHVVAKALQENIRITPKLLLQHQTISELILVLGRSATTGGRQEALTGAVPLTQIQHWFFELDVPNRNYWNQTMLFEMRLVPEVSLLKELFRQLVAHHDALRLRFYQDDSGWMQKIVSGGDEIPFDVIDISNVDSEKRAATIEQLGAELQSKLDITAGPILRAALFHCGPQNPPSLLVAIHHLAVDAVSWRIIVEDIEFLYNRLCEEQSALLSNKTTPYTYWARRLNEYAQFNEVKAELDYWVAQIGMNGDRLPLDYDGDNLEKSEASVIGSLSEHETTQILRSVPASFGVNLMEVLLSSLALAFEEWTGERKLCLDLEWHGREFLFEDVDLLHTVGFFTGIFPFCLDLRSTESMEEALLLTQKLYQGTPNHGIGYALLCYLCQDVDVSEPLRGAEPLEVIFSYLGQLDVSFSESSLFESVSWNAGGAYHDPEGSRTHKLIIYVYVQQNCMHVEFSYSRDLHKVETMERLCGNYLGNLKELIARKI